MAAHGKKLHISMHTFKKFLKKSKKGPLPLQRSPNRIKDSLCKARRFRQLSKHRKRCGLPRRFLFHSGYRTPHPLPQMSRRALGVAHIEQDQPHGPVRVPVALHICFRMAGPPAELTVSLLK